MDADQIKVARSGHISVAPFGTAVPTTPTEELDAAFFDLGYVTEDGVTFTAEPTVEDIKAWQSATPVKRLVTARALTVAWQGMEWDKDKFALAFGGGTWTEPESGVYRYDPPADTETLGEYVAVIDAISDGNHDRWIVKRGNVTDAVETNLVRSGPSLLPVTFSALTPDGDDTAWAYLTDDPTFDIVGS